MDDADRRQNAATKRCKPHPHDYRLRNGDVLSLDFAVSVDGWVADAAVTTIVGRAQRSDEELIHSTRDALAAGIASALPGNRVGDLSAAIGAVAASAGYPVNLEFGGHSVGRTMHGDLHILNDGRAGRGYRLRPGMVIALVGEDDVSHPDGSRRLDRAVGRREPRGAHGAHARDHGGRAARADRVNYQTPSLGAAHPH